MGTEILMILVRGIGVMDGTWGRHKDSPFGRPLRVTDLILGLFWVWLRATFETIRRRTRHPPVEPKDIFHGDSTGISPSKSGPAGSGGLLFPIRSGTVPIQSQVDQMVGSFIDHTTDWRSLAAMAAGGMASFEDLEYLDIVPFSNEGESAEIVRQVPPFYTRKGK